MTQLSKLRDLHFQLIQDARKAKAASRPEDVLLTKEAKQRASAAKRRAVADERAKEAEQRIADEAKRRSHNAEKTARLRELRLTREAALREAKAKLKTRGKRT